MLFLAAVNKIEENVISKELTEMLIFLYQSYSEEKSRPMKETDLIWEVHNRWASQHLSSARLQVSIGGTLQFLLLSLGYPAFVNVHILFKALHVHKFIISFIQIKKIIFGILDIIISKSHIFDILTTCTMFSYILHKHISWSVVKTIVNVIWINGITSTGRCALIIIPTVCATQGSVFGIK